MQTHDSAVRTFRGLTLGGLWRLTALVLLAAFLGHGCGGGGDLSSVAGVAIVSSGEAPSGDPPAPPDLQVQVRRQDGWVQGQDVARVVVDGSLTMANSLPNPPAPPDGQVNGTLTLVSGWNMVSFPLAEVTSLTLGDGVLDIAFAYDPAGQAYQNVDLKVPSQISAGEGTGRGFWVYADQASQIEYQGWANSGAHKDPSVLLGSGWNLIGFPYDQARAFSTTYMRAPGSATEQALPTAVSPTMPPPNASTLAFAFGYTYGNQAYQPVDFSVGAGTFQVGKAMWIYVHQDGTALHFDASGPELTPQGAGILSGGWHSLWVAPDGAVWAWGWNGYGQLGDGTTGRRTTPVQVQGISNASSADCGSLHSLGLKDDGTVWAWGRNNLGQLGDGTTTDRTTPVQVEGLNDVVAVAGGSLHSLALKGDGTVWAWGFNGHGQLGDGSTTDRTLPGQVPGLEDIVAVDGGALHSLALKSDGTVWTWGEGTAGQLGDKGGADRVTPGQVPGLASVVTVACGHDYCLALKGDGTVWMWGNVALKLRGESLYQYRSPVQVQGLTDVAALACGHSSWLALKVDGTVWAFGRNEFGQMGDATSTFRETPVQVQGVTNAVAVGCGLYHSLALKADGTVWAWGRNCLGQVGDGTTTDRSVAVHVALPGDAPVSGGPDEEMESTPTLSGSPVVAGTLISLKIAVDGTVWSWGRNDHGRLGNGSALDTLVDIPAPVRGLTGVVAVDCDCTHCLALKGDGTVWAWGDNEFGQLGDGTTTDRAEPVQVQGIQDVVAVACANYRSLALKSDGTVWAWGDNEFGQLGDGTTTDQTTPVQVPGLTGVVDVRCGCDRSMALKGDGSVWVWGSGMAGDGTSLYRATPVLVKDLSGVVAVNCSNGHSLAVKSDGTVWAWGKNTDGQLGDGTKTDRTKPVLVQGLSGVVAVDCGTLYHSLALKSDGTVWAWGEAPVAINPGSYRPYSSVVPMQVPELAGVAHVACGPYHIVALTSDGVPWVMGGTEHYITGDGARVDSDNMRRMLELP